MDMGIQGDAFDTNHGRDPRGFPALFFVRLSLSKAAKAQKCRKEETMQRKNFTTAIALVVALALVPAAGTVHAGKNKNAGCGIDLGPETRNYDDHVSKRDIETVIDAAAGDVVTATVVVQGVVDLDTYQVEIAFDPEKLELLQVSKDAPVSGFENILESKGGQCLGYESVDESGGVVNIANSLVGRDSAQAPDGSGVIAVLRFKILDDRPAFLNLENVVFMDSASNRDTISALANAKIE